MKREEANEVSIRPGDVYEYSCGNDQGYGYMIPVKTSGDGILLTLTNLIFHRENLEKQATTHPSGESSSLATASMMDM